MKLFLIDLEKRRLRLYFITLRSHWVEPGVKHQNKKIGESVIRKTTAMFGRVKRIQGNVQGRRG